MPMHDVALDGKHTIKSTTGHDGVVIVIDDDDVNADGPVPGVDDALRTATKCELTACLQSCKLLLNAFTGSPLVVR